MKYCLLMAETLAAARTHSTTLHMNSFSFKGARGSYFGRSGVSLTTQDPLGYLMTDKVFVEIIQYTR